MNGDYFSLLFPQGCRKYESLPPAFFGDLQMDGICRAIVAKYKEFDILKYFYTIPDSLHTMQYRQKIYQDIEQNSDMIVSLKQYMNQISACMTCFSHFQQVKDPVKKGSYLLLACRHYLSALELLRETLKHASIASEGFSMCLRRLEETFTAAKFQTFCDTVRESFAGIEQLTLTLLIQGQTIRIWESEYKEDENSPTVIEQLIHFVHAFDVPVEEEWETQSDAITNPFPSPLETGALENTIIAILEKSRPDVFNMLRTFASFEFSPEHDPFLLLKDELAFYISFYEFEKQLNSVGFQLSFPEIREDATLEVCGVYDLALAWKSRFSGQKIVSNDITYQQGKAFLVVTGPNQGGKTTLARAIGQSVYFMLIGLKAPCRSMKAKQFSRILTHFEVEESVETGAGKLKEELQRLKPMMRLYSQNSFVILNELFTTATTYDAKIMAQKVMKHFIRNECLGIYVTHIQELADEKAAEGIQSMVAQVDETDSSVRTFKIIPKEAEGLGYSDSIVKKYGLDFQQVTSRISEL